MTGYEILLVFLAALSLSALWLFLGRLSRFPCRTVRDVAAFLRPVDSDDLFELLDPQMEAILESSMTPLAFRMEQNRNLHYIREYMGRMAHNAAILLEWANAELSSTIVGRPPAAEEDYLECAQKLHTAALEFRIYAVLSLLKIKFWMALRIPPWMPFSSPTISELRSVWRYRFTALRVNLVTAVSDMSLPYGNDFREHLLRAL